METREELINGLKEAIRLMNKVTELKNKSLAVNNQQVNFKSKKEFGVAKGKKIIIAQIIVGIVVAVILSDRFVDIISIPVAIAAALLSRILFKKVIDKNNENVEKVNENIEFENKSIQNHNEMIQKKVAEINNELRLVQQEYRDKILPWYPHNYCNVYAAEFFLDAVLNYRADTIKEAVNLYETTQHQQRVEENQKIMHKKQDLANMLAFGNLITNMQTNQKLDQTNQKLDQANSTLGDIKSNTASRSHTVHHYFHK